MRPPTSSTLFPSRRSSDLYSGLIDALVVDEADADDLDGLGDVRPVVTRTLMRDGDARRRLAVVALGAVPEDRKSTRLNSSHVEISYAVFCLKKKKPRYTGT